MLLAVFGCLYHALTCSRKLGCRSENARQLKNPASLQAFIWIYGVRTDRWTSTTRARGLIVHISLPLVSKTILTMFTFSYALFNMEYSNIAGSAFPSFHMASALPTALPELEHALDCVLYPHSAIFITL